MSNIVKDFIQDLVGRKNTSIHNDYDSNDVYYGPSGRIKTTQLMNNLQESVLSRSLGSIYAPDPNNFGRDLKISNLPISEENIQYMMSQLHALKEELKPAVAVITCKHCGQWGARYCECRKCGAPIE